MITPFAQSICDLMELAGKNRDNYSQIQALKKALKDNDFKLCFMSADIMIGEMIDMGMDESQGFYWRALAAGNLPHAPWQALTE